ncbi:hypothetical protein [Saccharothrix obliqua]|uniref:hypothetical protein n=1 Tax=Saccharothrix obliqua TaxID=2861747 RepID=UPI001C5D2429|nr:hypothetical protein [Saccharothrix obliqua]MBW4716481.1 hypothetical protein [Saccharothrix obliqua]
MALVPAGLFCLIPTWPLALTWGPTGAAAMLGLSAATPVAGYALAKRRAKAALGRFWRQPFIDSRTLRAVPRPQYDLLHDMATSLHAMWTSRAARAGWLAADKLRDAHHAVWEASLLVLGSVDEHHLLRESAQYDQLSSLVRERAAELAKTMSVAEEVAGRLAEASAKVAEVDDVLRAEEERRDRERHIARLERELTSGTGPPPPEAALPTWQDAMDAVNAHVDGALTVLSLDR